MNLDKLHADVTDAIITAEQLLEEAARAWRKVANIERKLSHEERGELLRTIAGRGVWTAALKARMLEALSQHLSKDDAR